MPLGKDETCDKYLRVFKSRIEIINAHEGAAGSHTSQTNRMLSQVMKERPVSTSNVKVLNPDKKKKNLYDANAVARQEYIVCLFVKYVSTNCVGEPK